MWNLDKNKVKSDMNVKWGLFVFGEENQWWEESESRG
jgi:hypothetical protein